MAVWGEELALLHWLCGSSQQGYFHSKCVTAMNKREMGVVAEAVRTIKGNASALHMLRRRRVSVCWGKRVVVWDRVQRGGVCMKTRGKGSTGESGWVDGGQRVGTRQKRLYIAVKESAWKELGAESACERLPEKRWEAQRLCVAQRWTQCLHGGAKGDIPFQMLRQPFAIAWTTPS